MKGKRKMEGLCDRTIYEGAIGSGGPASTIQ